MPESRTTCCRGHQAVDDGVEICLGDRVEETEDDLDGSRVGDRILEYLHVRLGDIADELGDIEDRGVLDERPLQGRDVRARDVAGEHIAVPCGTRVQDDPLHGGDGLGMILCIGARTHGIPCGDDVGGGVGGLDGGLSAHGYYYRMLSGSTSRDLIETDRPRGMSPEDVTERDFPRRPGGSVARSGSPGPRSHRGPRGGR